MLFRSIPADVRALQWNSTADNTYGWIEFVDNSENQQITELPAWALCAQAIWEETNYAVNNPPPPTDAELVNLVKLQAEQELKDSDWAVLPDVPLTNKSDWESYRAALRSIAINPTINPVWPTKPANIWS